MDDELVKRLRDAAIRADSGNEIGESFYRDIMQAADTIEELKKRVPKTPHGRWNNIIQGIIPSGQCSNCGAWDKVTRFCPNCGSRMEGE